MRKMGKKQIPTNLQTRFQHRLFNEKVKRQSKKCLVVDEILPPDIVAKIDKASKTGTVDLTGNVLKRRRTIKSVMVKN